jgi:heptosyltransferase-2
MIMYKTQIHLSKKARILVVKLAGIGDLLLATPALRALRETYPQAQIDLLVTPDSAGLLNGWEIIDNILVLDKYLFDDPKAIVRNPRTLLRLRDVWRTLRAGRYDAVLLLHHLTLPFGRLKHQVLMRATGAKWRVGLDNGHGWFLNVRVKDRGFGALHEAEYTMAVAEAVGATIRSRQLELPLQEQERTTAKQIVYESTTEQDSVRPIIALHPGSGGYSTARRWAPERFAQLADTLFDEVGGQVLLMGGPEEAELHQSIIGMLRSNVPVRSLAGRGNIKVAAAILEQVDLFIGNDAGLMHIAAAVKAPTVAIFGLSNAKAWGPYTGEAKPKRATIVQIGLPCIPCFYRDHQLGTPEGCTTRDCLAMLGTDPVIAAARRMLKEGGMGSEQKRQSFKNSTGNIHTA